MRRAHNIGRREPSAAADGRSPLHSASAVFNRQSLQVFLAMRGGSPHWRVPSRRASLRSSCASAQERLSEAFLLLRKSKEWHSGRRNIFVRHL